MEDKCKYKAFTDILNSVTVKQIFILAEKYPDVFFKDNILTCIHLCNKQWLKMS